MNSNQYIPSASSVICHGSSSGRKKHVSGTAKSGSIYTRGRLSSAEPSASTSPSKRPTGGQYEVPDGKDWLGIKSHGKMNAYDKLFHDLGKESFDRYEEANQLELANAYNKSHPNSDGTYQEYQTGGLRKEAAKLSKGADAAWNTRNAYAAQYNNSVLGRLKNRPKTIFGKPKFGGKLSAIVRKSGGR